MSRIDSYILGLLGAALIVTTYLVYAPGISGPFLLDDFSNLSGLAHVQRGGWPEGVLQYLATNTSGQLGRPISLLSFLVDAESWPASPESFKRTNIILHTLCTLLVFVLSCQIARCFLKADNLRVGIAGAIAAAIWALHPLQVSTVLYVIQRMTILATVFCVAGLICVMHGREKVRQADGKAWLWLGGFALCAAAAVLSKENGVLIFPLALLVLRMRDHCFHDKAPRWYRFWFYLFVVLPTILIISYFLVSFSSIVDGYSRREFTLAERLLTQPRVFALYLYNIFVPSSVSASLYHDSFALSRGLFNPPSTAVALAAFLVLVALAFIKRWKWVWVTFPLVWFLIGHSIEGSIVPLEMVFEHRNYLPMIGMAATLGAAAMTLWSGAKAVWQKCFIVLVGVYIAGMTLPWTAQAVDNWSDESRLIYTWAFYDESSIRAQIDFAQLVAVQGQPTQAIKILEALREKYPREITIRLRLASYYCEYKGGVPESVWSDLDWNDHDVFRVAVLGAASKLIKAAQENLCDDLSKDYVERVFYALIALDGDRVSRQVLAHLHFLYGNYLIEEGEVRNGFSHLGEASKLQPTVDVPLVQASKSLQFGDPDGARYYLGQASERNASRPAFHPSREKEIQALYDLAKEVETKIISLPPIENNEEGKDQ